jgi:hypothetical protein
MPGLKSGRSFDSAVPPRTWPTHLFDSATWLGADCWAGGRPENSADFHPCRVMNSARRTGAMVSDAQTERGSDQIRPDGGTMILGTTLGIIYIVLLVVFGILCFRKGHWVLGLIGIIFPILWIIGAILPSRYVRR